MESESYNIQINDQSYPIKCSDGEEHVRLIEKRLHDAFGVVSGGSQIQNLSPYALKVAITLADQGIRDAAKKQAQEKLLTERLTPLLERLDQVLGHSSSHQTEVAFSAKPA